MWRQEAVRALQQGKDVVSIRDVDPTNRERSSQASRRFDMRTDA